MTVDSPTSLTGMIPPQPDGTIVQYYLAINDADGESQNSPTGGVINPHSFYVGELVELYCTDFEDVLGSDFLHELVGGIDEAGADDWQLGYPAGSAGDPDSAYSGDQLWGNDLGFGNYNGEYQHDKHNRLFSPPIDVSGANGAPLLLQFRRWLTVEDGYYDHAWVEVDDNHVWENHTTVFEVGDEHHLDDGWALATYSITDPDDDGFIELSWHMESDQGLAFGGWNLDDVCVYTLATEIGQGDPEGDPGPGIDLDPAASDDDPSVDGENDGLSAGGCACTATPATPATGWWVLLVGLLGTGWRRRR
jgi:MYXO-CTERM domain-containing protein